MFINKTILFGNLTKDVDLRATTTGKSVASFTIATNRKWKDAHGKEQEDAQFHNCVAWGKTAELMKQYLAKGSSVYVEGRLQTRAWEAKDGGKRYSTEVIVESMQFGHKAQGSEFKRKEEEVPSLEADVQEFDISQIPF